MSTSAVTRTTTTLLTLLASALLLQLKVSGVNKHLSEQKQIYSEKPYTPRAERPEWDAVGMLGVLNVRDDGTCHVNGFCKVADGGIATASDKGY